MEDIKNKNIEIEVEGKTVEEAVKRALVILKVPKNQLKIQIVSEEQKGLFGMKGAKSAKIRASTVPPPVLKKKT